MCWKFVKGGNIWVGAKDREHTWVQCQNCGKVYQVDKKVPINVSIVKMKCPRCGSYNGLNCGSRKDDIYLYMNPNVDERYFNY